MSASHELDRAQRQARSKNPPHVCCLHAATLDERVLDDGPAPAIPNDEILKAERHIPDGAPPAPGEHRMILPFVIGLAIIGLLLVVAGMAWTNGWEAAAVGAAWVLMGYFIAWIVVWGAGMIRATEERDIETHIIAGSSHAPLAPLHAHASRH